jgi:hypothetical protein
MPLRNVFGWQRPCYLLNEGYAKTFTELMAETEWQDYGVGRYEKCADCMVHCGFEGTAAADAIRNPLKLARVAMRGVRTEGPMAPDVDLSHARPAEETYSTHVERELARIRAEQPAAKRRVAG